MAISRKWLRIRVGWERESVKIRNVNDRKKAEDERIRLVEEWHDLVTDTDFDNEDDAAGVQKQIDALDAEIKQYDEKFPDALKRNLAKRETEAGDSLKSALDVVEKLPVSEEQKKQLRKTIVDAAKTTKRHRTRAYSGIDSIEDMQTELEDLRGKLTTLRERMDAAPLHSKDRFYDDIDSLEKDIADKEHDILLAERGALKAAQDASAAAAAAVDEVQAIAEVHDGDVTVDEDGNPQDSEELALAKSLYATAFNTYRKYVVPHIPNDASIELALEATAKTFLGISGGVRAIANTQRDRRREDAMLTMASIIELPGRAISEAVTANDAQPRVAADWRDVLKTVKNKAKDLAGSGDKLADSDAKAFASVMKSLESKYATILANLPTGKVAAGLQRDVAAYMEAATSLKSFAHNEREFGDYPGLSHLLVTVADSMLRYGKLMKKALS